MPMSPPFQNRLFPKLEKIAGHYGTPFHIYDEAGIRETGARLKKAFAGIDGFREYFAVKALPNLRILQLMREMGFGFDCSSIPELIMSRQIGARGDDIMFTSNNTSQEEFLAAEAGGGCILNLDDISLIAKVPKFPETDLLPLQSRAAPHRQRHHRPSGRGEVRRLPRAGGRGLPAGEGARRQTLRPAYHGRLERARLHLHRRRRRVMLLEIAELVQKELDIRFEFVNIGGGLGIPYRPDRRGAESRRHGQGDHGALRRLPPEARLRAAHAHGERPFHHRPARLSGDDRHQSQGYLPQVHRRRRLHVGADAPGSLRRLSPHHVIGKEHLPKSEVYDIVGSLCENNDKFAVQRELPPISEGDLLVIHDTGAHGHAMGFQYNGRLRPKELLLRTDGTVELIRRAETIEDYLRTQEFAADVLSV